MKIWSTEVFTTTKLYVEHNGINYIIIHSDDHDGYFIPEWRITDEDDDEVIDREIRDELIRWTKNHIEK